MKMEDNSDVTLANVKVYTKNYKKKNGDAVESIQKMITLKKDAPYEDKDSVAILPIEFYNKLTSDIDITAENDSLNTINKLNETIESLKTKIEDLTTKNEQLNDDKEHLRVQNEIKTTELLELSVLRERNKNHNKVLRLITGLLDAEAKNLINTTVNEVTAKNNEVIASLGLIKRIKGVTLETPAIDNEELKKDTVNKLKRIISNNLLE